MSRLRILCAVLILAVPSCLAKDVPFQTLAWPDSGTPVLQFSFSKFKQIVGGVAKEHGFVTDVTAENVSGRPIGSINLALYIFDKTHARIGDGIINLSNVGVADIVKFELTLYASGTPASVALAPLAAKTLSITVNSVPQGALIRLDGKEMGTTPKIVDVTVGKHMLEFSKEGYTSGKYPLEMGPRDGNGGSVSYELGTSNHDTIELRDGSVLSGDLLSINNMEVQIRIGGNTQTYDRNQIKRILLTQREPPP